MQLSQFRKKISWVAIIMVLQRTPFLPWAKNAVLFAGSMIEKVWTWKMALPVAATAGGWHSLSGATSYVSSSQSNSATVQEGEFYSFQFRTTGYIAYSYSVVGLPSGLSYNGSYSSPTISGTPNTPGTYPIGITGFRRSGQNGDSTATYYLTLNVEENEVLDTDGDGFSDENDIDDDGDGVLDTNDAFPLDATETLDTDGDGTGNHADNDDDGDGVNDSADAFPLDATETLDTDGDGTGNHADTDDDGDGVSDSADAFPLDATETLDTDGDGTGNHADTDDDGDGVSDSADVFPLDATETLDTDGDGTGNHADTDDDGDGVSDSDDAFPLDAAETLDTDGDGTGNHADTDDDGDGVNDSNDAFPLDPTKSVSTTQEQEETNQQDGSNSSEISNEETSQSAMVIWSDSNTTDLGSGWFESSWFGNFYGNAGGWTYHLNHQWIYLAETSNGGLWIYDDSLGWLYTEKGVYPYLLRNSNGHWIYDLSTPSERKFWDATDQSTITP